MFIDPQYIRLFHGTDDFKYSTPLIQSRSTSIKYVFESIIIIIIIIIVYINFYLIVVVNCAVSFVSIAHMKEIDDVLLL